MLLAIAVAGRPVAACAVWLIVAATARRSSLASLAAIASAPITALWLADSKVVWLALGIAVMVIGRHHENIRRLLAGTEPKIGRGGSPRPRTG